MLASYNNIILHIVDQYRAFILHNYMLLNVNCLAFVVVSANGISLFANISDKSGNGIQLPTAGHQNESKLLNITGNKLNPETTTVGTSVYKTPTTNYSPTPSISGLLEGSEGGKGNISKNATILPTSLSTMESTTKPSTTHFRNYTTTSPSHGFPRHHFNMKLLDYIIIPIGCLLAIVISYFLVSNY